MNRSFQPAITAVLLSAALVLLAALPSSAGIGDGRHLVRKLSTTGLLTTAPRSPEPALSGMAMPTGTGTSTSTTARA